MGINIRPYTSGDAKPIFNLFQEYSKYKRDASFWIWMNRLLTDSIVAVAEEKGKILGHYAILPRTCVLTSGLELKAGLGVHAFVMPNRSNEVSIFSISNLAYKLAKEKGIDFVYGFPNQNYRLIQEKIEKWKKVSLFNALIKNASSFKVNAFEYNWEEIKQTSLNFLYHLNEMLESESISQIHFKRTVDYWNKRYFLHPQNPYDIWEVTQAGKKSIVILKIFQEDTITKLHLVDYVFEAEVDLNKVIDDIAKLYEGKFDNLVFWPFNKLIYRKLINHGFSETGFDTFFAIKKLNQELPENLFDFEDWHLVMGDSDAF